MNWLTSMSQSDRDEIEADLKASFNGGIITEDEFRKQMGKMGYNATDLEDLVKYHRPNPPENED